MKHPTPTKITTLGLVYKHPKLLLGLKKRGFGEGRWNGYGGKIENGETLEENVVREMREECGITPTKFERRGKFYCVLDHIGEIVEVNLFAVGEFDGDLVETEEMKPQWFDVSDLPWKEMWDEDRFWYPLFLAGKNFKANFLFDGQEKVIKHEIEEI